ncbi:MAG: hypothetical protein ACLFVO_25325 [Chloroflexaceae bacterium]
MFADAANEPMLLLAYLHRHDTNQVVPILQSALIAPEDLPQVVQYFKDFPASAVEYLPGKPFIVRGGEWIGNLLQNPIVQPLKKLLELRKVYALETCFFPHYTAFW